MNLGENIYQLRTEKGMSQEDLAAALDVSRQSVSKWENSSATPDLEKLIKISEVFGITLDELVYGNRIQQTAQFEPEVQEKPEPPAGSAEGLIRFAVVFFAMGLAMIVNGVLLGFFSGQLRQILVWCGLMCLAVSGIGALFLLGE